MTFDRCKDHDWSIGKLPSGGYSYDAAQLAVLLDIRDELKGIRRRLDCPIFMKIPNTLADIRRNTAKKRKPRK